MSKIFKSYRGLCLSFLMLLILITVSYLAARNVLLKKQLHEKITPYISDEKERARIAREKYPDIDIIINEDEGVWDKKNESKVEIIHELTIGGNDEEENVNKTFYLPTPIVADDKGNIYVGESMGDCQIRKFNPNGDYLLTIAGKGRGPGEFLGGSFTFDNNGILFVVDYGNQRISQFTPDGKFITSDQLSKYINGTSFTIDNDGSIFISFYDKEIEKIIHKFNVNGKYLFSFGDPVYYKKPLKIQYLPYIEMASSGPIININNDEILYSLCNPYEIRKYSKRGEIKMVLLRKNSFMPPAELEISKKGGYIYSVPAKSTFIGEWNDMIINCVWIPPHYFKKLGTVIDIFDQFGQLLTSLKLESSISFTYIDQQGKLYGTCTHQENWPIVRYALKMK